ncbi:uncharacterized protein LOC132282596 isoform X2 [Cornus florida]|uniref:uncharacterized protein LOC132282596 isoform X2 n=1 Tax=Cornus florida TaxID=4283 RepID=UPI002897C82C|nr:uncharacterized protein LOC132282596 isoform X2 [Cornus florida]
MFATAIRYMAKKPKPKMKPIELKAPPEQTQTITRVIFDILKEHGPLTIADTWERVQILKQLEICEYKDKVSILWSIKRGSWFERTDKQKAHENSIEMDEGEAEA